MKKLLSILLVLLLLPLSVSLAEEKPLTSQAKLPTDDFSFGALPLQGGYYTESRVVGDETLDVSCYRDESIYCEVYTRRMQRADCHIAYVKIADASQLRTMLASEINNKPEMGTTDMAKAVNAVVAINGDYFLYRKDGEFIVRQSRILKAKPSSELDQLIIDYNGDFHIITSADKSGEIAELDGQIYQAFTFGPALVVDGILQERKDYTFESDSRDNQRTAIGQIGKLEYVFVVVDGRSDSSRGLSCWTLAEVMQELGCVQAYNLDGGGSSTLVWQGARRNVPLDKLDRSVSDCIYFATLVNSGDK